MKSRRKKNVAKQALAAAPSADLMEFPRAWLLGVLAALFVARPLLPSEAVSWAGDGQPFDMLWIMLAAGYLFWSLARGRLERPLDLVDLGVAALVLFCAASALVASRNRADELELGLIGTASPRLTINMLWEWVALGLAFFLTRQLIRTAREARTLVAIMIALAVVLSCFGYYQVFVGLPEARERYAQNPDRVLSELNQWFPEGSPERSRFESRLHSTEPLATFALTNSLAGFLAPWLVVALGVCWSLRGIASRQETSATGAAVADRWTELARLSALAACLLAVAGCLLLTKSRSGYVALAVGLVLLPLAGGLGRRFFNWRVAAGGAAVLLLLVGGALAVRGLDAQVLTEAGKSFGYRWQYWRSTLELIGRYPWLGVGPGSFQDYYTQVKLPEASEEIRDPHNFLLEVWSTGGTFAFAAIVAVLGMFFWRVWNRPAVSWGVPAEPDRAAADSPRTATFMAGGAAAGFLLAFVVGPTVGLSFSEEDLIGGLAVGVVVTALLWPWIARGELPPRLPAIGFAVLAIHLLASGGIAFPGVAGTFWMLLALGLNQLDGEPSPSSAECADAAANKSVAVRLGLVAAVALTACAGVACYHLGYRPGLARQTAMAKADELRQDLPARVRGYYMAAQADPLSAEPWRAIAEVEMQRLRVNPQAPRSFQDFAAATKRMTELESHSSSTWRQAGRWYSELVEKTPDEDVAATAVEYLRNAVELYPNLATLQGEYALALDAAGQGGPARVHAERALELNQLTPHADKKLAPDLAERLQALLARLTPPKIEG